MQQQRGFIVGLIGLLWTTWAAAAPVHHSLEVTLQPGTAGIEVRDSVSLPPGHPPSLTFSLHPALTPTLPDGNARLVELAPQTDRNQPVMQAAAGSAPRRYRLELAPGENSFTLHYTGSIAHALQNRGEEYARSFQETRGIISAQGVFLSLIHISDPTRRRDSSRMPSSA